LNRNTPLPSVRPTVTRCHGARALVRRSMVILRSLRAGVTFTPPTTQAFTASATRGPFWAIPGLIVRRTPWSARAARSVDAPFAGAPVRASVEAVRAVAQVSAMIADFKTWTPRRSTGEDSTGYPASPDVS
jgi:hypothetical protein